MKKLIILTLLMGVFSSVSVYADMADKDYMIAATDGERVYCDGDFNLEYPNGYGDVYKTIYSADMNLENEKIIYSSEDNAIETLGVNGEYLYFNEYASYNEDVSFYWTVGKLKCVNLKNGEIINIADFPAEIKISDDYIYFTQTGTGLYCTAYLYCARADGSDMKVVSENSILSPVVYNNGYELFYGEYNKFNGHRILKAELDGSNSTVIKDWDYNYDVSDLSDIEYIDYLYDERFSHIDDMPLMLRDIDDSCAIFEYSNGNMMTYNYISGKSTETKYRMSCDGTKGGKGFTLEKGDNSAVYYLYSNGEYVGFVGKSDKILLFEEDKCYYTDYQNHNKLGILSYKNEYIAVVADFNRVIFEDIKPQLINDRLYIPVRAAAQALGLSVKWDEETKTVIFTSVNRTVTNSVGSDVLYVDGKELKLPYTSLNSNGRCLMSIRMLAEAFDADISWDSDLNLAVINTNDYIFNKK